MITKPSSTGSTSSSAIIHVSPTGDDANAGLCESPVKTISEAARRAMPGDTVLIHPGIYRERVDPPRGGISDSCRIVYQTAEPGRAVIRGSEIVKAWQRECGDVWVAKIPNALFGEFNPFGALLRGHWFIDKGRKHHRGAVYLNGHWLAEAATPEALGKTHDGDPLWFAEVGGTMTTVRAEFRDVNPNEECVEVNVRPTVFYPSSAGCNFITVRGLLMEHAATPWCPPTTEQIGVLGTNWAKGWIIEDNIVRYAITAGITLGKYHDPLDYPDLDIVEGTVDEDTYHGTIRRALEHGWSLEGVGNHTVRNNRVSHCEMAGICGSFGAVRCLIEGNVIHDIHMRQLFFGCEQAGIKFHAPIDSVIRGNRIFRCYRGMWLDWMTQGTRISGNLFYENGPEHDLFIEVSHGPFVVDNNLLLSSRSLNSWSEGGVYAHNLVCGSVDAQAELDRVTPYHEAHSTTIAGWKSVSLGNDCFLNNVFAAVKGLSDYDVATEPVSFENNLFLGRASPSIHDSSAQHLKEFPVDAFRLETLGEKVYLSCKTGWAGHAGKLISSDTLERNPINGLAYDQPDGSPVILSEDYFGEPRTTAAPLVGPFASLAGEQGLVCIWPVKSWNSEAK